MNANKESEQKSTTGDVADDTENEDWNYAEKMKDLSNNEEETPDNKKKDDTTKVESELKELRRVIKLQNEENENLTKYIEKNRKR